MVQWVGLVAELWVLSVGGIGGRVDGVGPDGGLGENCSRLRLVSVHAGKGVCFRECVPGIRQLLTTFTFRPWNGSVVDLGNGRYRIGG